MPILQNDVDLSLLDHEMTSQALIVETRVLTALVCVLPNVGLSFFLVLLLLPWLP